MSLIVASAAIVFLLGGLHLLYRRPPGKLITSTSTAPIRRWY